MADSSNLRLFELLAATADELVAGLGADACTVSRVIGDVLILVAERSPEGMTLQMGQGYLVPDYPLTQSVLTSGRPRALTLADKDVDPAEASVLEELGFASLLILSLPVGGTVWGLVEVYRLEPRPFVDADIMAATAILARTSARVAG